MNSSQGFPRLALFLCGCAAFLNLYTTPYFFYKDRKSVV